MEELSLNRVEEPDVFGFEVSFHLGIVKRTDWEWLQIEKRSIF